MYTADQRDLLNRITSLKQQYTPEQNQEILQALEQMRADTRKEQAAMIREYQQALIRAKTGKQAR